jgi:hypothetical protein
MRFNVRFLLIYVMPYVAIVVTVWESRIDNEDGVLACALVTVIWAHVVAVRGIFANRRALSRDVDED